MLMPYADPHDKRRANREYYEKLKARGDPATASLKKGAMNVRLPLQLIARIVRVKDEGIATGIYPWRSTSAVVEALLVKGFESMAGDPFIDEMLQYLRATSQIEGIAAHRREAQAAVSRFKTEIAELLKIKAEDQAVAYFHAIYHDFEQMDANVWRDWALREMRNAYPHLHKGTPKAMALVPRLGERRARHEPRQPDRRTRGRR